MGARGTGTGVEALRRQRQVSLAQLAALDPQAWELPCGPPWRVREVVAHIITIDEAAASGRLLPLLRSRHGRVAVERWNDASVRDRAAASPAELLRDLGAAGERLAARAGRLPRPVWRLPLRTVFGRHPLAFLLARRVLDEWVHLADVARVSGEDRPVVPDGGAEALATAVLCTLPTLVLPHLDVTVGVVRLVVLTGGLGSTGDHDPRRTWSVDFARRHYGPRVTARPDALVRLHAAELALRAEGRAPFGTAAGAEIEGDTELGRLLLDGLGSYTRPRTDGSASSASHAERAEPYPTARPEAGPPHEHRYR